MSPLFQIIIAVIGAMLTGLSAGILYILSDLRHWIGGLSDRVDRHIEDHSIHTGTMGVQTA